MNFQGSEMKKTLTFSAIEVKQTPDADPFYLLKDSAEDILEWCDVPRKQEEFMAGYQRALDDRYTHITNFFSVADEDGNSGKNIIPSSVIIAARQEAIRIRPLSEGSSIVEVEIDIEDRDLSESYMMVLDELKKRLSPEELDSLKLEKGLEDSEEDQSADESEGPPDSYLAQIVKLLDEIDGDFEKLEEGQREVVIDFIKGVSKPGLILDGQHRVFGAKNVSAYPVYLPIVLLPGLSYSEQVFHFYVLNNKAKPLNKTELRTIISTSLSKKEIDELYNRFKQVGVTAEETEWAYRMYSEPVSPFYKLIDLKLSAGNYPIAENVAYQVVSKFMKPNRKYKSLFSDVPNWDNLDFRINMFFAFWQTIKGLYPTACREAVDGSNRQILQKVSLINLQEYLFDQFNQGLPRRLAKKEPSPFSDEATLRVEIQVLLAYLKEEFFLKRWTAKGLDTGTGNKFFRRQLDDAITDQCQNLGNRALFKRVS
jgi:hypothetical protein